MRAILVVGIEGSGTSCVAQILHKLGIDMGRIGPKFEDRDIHEVYGKSQETVEGWIRHRISQGKEIWGVKFPLLHHMLLGIIAGMKKQGLEDIKLIVVKRYKDCIIQSNYEKRKYAHASEPNYREHIERSVDKGIGERDEAAKNAGIPTLDIDYDVLVDYPWKVMAPLVNFCFVGLDEFPKADRIIAAADSIDRSKRHWVSP